MNTSIVIADDHALILRGLTDFLTEQGYNIIGSTDDGHSAYNMIVKLKPEIAILDINMPCMTGLDVAEACNKNKLPTKIILLTLEKDEKYFDKAIEYNVYGYILKEFAIDQIETCIEHVVKGSPYFSEDISPYLVKTHLGNRPDTIELLTKSELKIVKLISKNKTSQEIAEELSISVRTVDKHRSNVVQKLELGNRPTSLSIWANLNKSYF
ncbi:response regulator [Tamlana sp. I1]|uniref:response regulator n=1 Tax=Tamlana sp. I1 TaxID=2762061 RepID=UPI00188F88D8|nr:response regulator transcription factor [Tamlana sp. I1]